MTQLLAVLLMTILFNPTLALASGEAHDWRITAGLGPNFMQFDAVQDDLESDIGFSVWGDYYFGKQWFGHVGYDHFEFVGPAKMDSFTAGPGFEFPTWDVRWFPYIKVGAGLSSLQDFPNEDTSKTTEPTINIRPGIEYAVTDNWFVGLNYNYLHIFTNDDTNGYDIALPFVSFTYSLNRLADSQREAAAPEPQQQVRTSAKDSDRDGVRDTIDACPGTPRGTPVDEIGCQYDEGEDITTDTDQDTIVDAYDQCRNTPRGAKVNGFGCQVKEKIQMRLTVNFEWDSDVIDAQYYKQLNKVATLMKRNPKAKLLIEGHTDSTGSMKYNMNLSRRRAGAIRTFLVDGGLVESKRVTSEGYGPTRPVRTNKTEEGRAENRRILATFFY